jgi:hypothetical protein
MVNRQKIELKVFFFWQIDHLTSNLNSSLFYEVYYIYTGINTSVGSVIHL